jgi:hypothetical protein
MTLVSPVITTDFLYAAKSCSLSSYAAYSRYLPKFCCIFAPDSMEYSMKRRGGVSWTAPRAAEELSARMGDGMFFADSTKRVAVFIAAKAFQ